MNLKQTLFYISVLFLASVGASFNAPIASAASPCGQYQGNQKTWCDTGYASTKTSHADCVTLGAKNPSTNAEAMCLVGWNAKQKDSPGGGGTTTPNNQSTADAGYLKTCIASGKSEADCKKVLAENIEGCKRSVNNNDYKNESECLSARAVTQYGICADGSKPDIKLGKCADGTTPKMPTTQTSPNTPGNNGGTPTPNPGANVSGSDGKCAGVDTSLITCDGTGEGAIIGVLSLVIQILSAGVGILAVAGIVYGAILYASAQDNSGQTQKAITVITNTVIGLLLYVFMVVIINWLVPGGVIG